MIARAAASAVIVAALVAWAARRRLMVVTVRGISMTPALEPDDRVLVDRARRRALKVGDVVALRDPAAPAERDPQMFLKRVTALPGDRLPTDVPARGAATGVVPPSHVVLRGDFEHSLDSRTWGCVPEARVVGVVRRRLGPPRVEGRRADASFMQPRRTAPPTGPP